MYTHAGQFYERGNTQVAYGVTVVAPSIANPIAAGTLKAASNNARLPNQSDMGPKNGPVRPPMTLRMPDINSASSTESPNFSVYRRTENAVKAWRTQPNKSAAHIGVTIAMSYLYGCPFPVCPTSTFAHSHMCVPLVCAVDTLQCNPIWTRTSAKQQTYATQYVRTTRGRVNVPAYRNVLAVGGGRGHLQTGQSRTLASRRWTGRSSAAVSTWPTCWGLWVSLPSPVHAVSSPRQGFHSEMSLGGTWVAHQHQHACLRRTV